MIGRMHGGGPDGECTAEVVPLHPCRPRQPAHRRGPGWAACYDAPGFPRC